MVSGPPQSNTPEVFMVRFKNRYFLLELVPFRIDEESNISAKKRYHSDKAIFDVSEEVNCAIYETFLPSFTPASVSSCIRNSITLNYGQYAGSSLLQSLSVKYSNTSTNMVILRVPRDFFSEIWISLAFLTEWPAENPLLSKNLKCTWRALHCAGTIRSCQKAAISYARKVLSDKSSNEQDLEPLAKKIKAIDP